MKGNSGKETGRTKTRKVSNQQQINYFQDKLEVRDSATQRPDCESFFMLTSTLHMGIQLKATELFVESNTTKCEYGP